MADHASINAPAEWQRLVFASATRLALASTVFLSVAFGAAAGDGIEGQYLQNRPCRGDSRDPANLKVSITPEQIAYSGGICAIDSRRKEGPTSFYEVTCKFRSGRTLGAEISLTPRGDDRLHMVQQDGSFEADLYRCPERAQ